MASRHNAAQARILAGGDIEDGAIFKKIDGRIASRLFTFARPYRMEMGCTLLVVLVFAAVQVSIPYTLRYAIDSAVGKSHFPLHWILLCFAGLVILNGVFSFLQEWMSARLAQRIIFDMRRAMFSHLHHVSIGLLDRLQVGHLMSRLQGDVGALQEFLESSVSAVGDLFLLSGIVVMLLVTDGRLGGLTLTVLPVLVVLRLVWMPFARKTFSRAREASSRANSALAENINGIRTVQENRREAFNLQGYERKAREYLDAQVSSSRVSQVMVPVVDLLTGVALAVVVVAGTDAVLSGRLGIGVMVACIFYVQRFFDPIRTLSMQYTVAQRAVAAGHRILEVLDLPVDVKENANGIVLDDFRPSIELRGVTFGYQPGQAVLHDISLHIAPYQTVALVGATGSGKTSIISLIRRFYDVWQGSVLIGGHDVREIDSASLGRAVAMVLQEPFLFSCSILDNIRYGLPDASREDAIAAAKTVRAHQFISQLPEGYDTLLGQRGRNISIGQRQLLSFARALLVDPKILILDEATANIDSFTEREIQIALKTLLKGRTCLMIAHRLATVRNADQIVVLDKGRIVEKGTHEELLARAGFYARLHHQDAAEVIA